MPLPQLECHPCQLCITCENKLTWYMPAANSSLDCLHRPSSSEQPGMLFQIQIWSFQLPTFYRFPNALRVETKFVCLSEICRNWPYLSIAPPTQQFLQPSLPGLVGSSPRLEACAPAATSASLPPSVPYYAPSSRGCHSPLTDIHDTLDSCI